MERLPNPRSVALASLDVCESVCVCVAKLLLVIMHHVRLCGVSVSVHVQPCVCSYVYLGDYALCVSV